MSECPLCGDPTALGLPTAGDYAACICSFCGSFELSGSADTVITVNGYDRKKIGSAARKRWIEAGGRVAVPIHAIDLAVLLSEGD